MSVTVKTLQQFRSAANAYIAELEQENFRLTALLQSVAEMLSWPAHGKELNQYAESIERELSAIKGA